MTGPSVTGSCPKCGSTAIHAVSAKRASVGDALAKEFFQTATAAGAAGAQDTVTQGVCTRCGCRWVPRTGEERRLRALSGQLGQEAKLAALAAASAETARAAAKGPSIFARFSPMTWLLIVGILIEIVLLIVT